MNYWLIYYWYNIQSIIYLPTV